VQQGLANWHEDRWSEMSRGMGKEASSSTVTSITCAFSGGAGTS